MVDRSSLAAALEALRGYRVYLAHNANVDAMCSASGIAPVLEEPVGDDRSGPIDSPATLTGAIADAMARGDGDLVAITDEFGAWLEANVEPAETRLGGQAALMADLLSVVGADPVLYTYLLTEAQRQRFTDPDAIEFPVVDDGCLDLVPLSTVTNAERTKINWIFEFDAGDSFYDEVAAATSRFIAAARPERVDLETGLDGVATDLAADVDCALLSGYHSMKAEYADGSTGPERIERGREFLHRLTRDHDLPVQVEYGVTHKEGLRAAIARRLLPEVDAVGLDSRELGLLLADLGLDEGPILRSDRRAHADTGEGRAVADTPPVAGSASDADASPDADAPGTASGPSDTRTPRETDAGSWGDGVVATYRKVESVRRELGIDCVKVHRTHYFLAATADGYCTPDAIRRGWDVASIVAAAKATKGTIRSVEDLEVGLCVDYSEEGRAAVADLADHLGVGVEADAVATDRVVAHPNRVVSDPESTVGLGDSVSAANFAVEQALAQQPEQSLRR